MAEKKKSATEQELLGRKTISRVLAALDENARRRVVRWLCDRYGEKGDTRDEEQAHGQSVASQVEKAAPETGHDAGGGRGTARYPRRDLP